MATPPRKEDEELIDLDFTGVFRIEELRAEPVPPPPKTLPEEILIGARAVKKGNSFINMTRPRPARKIDPAKTTILLVEDDKTTRLIIEVILKKAGYLTRQAGDASSFIAAIQKKPLPNCVILDVELPGGVSGFKILGKMRAHPVLKTIPVVILTVRSEPADLVQAVSLGTDAYLTKPANAKSLLDAISAVLGAGEPAKK